MKKTILFLIGLLMISIVTAIPVPYVIGGKVTAGGIPTSGIEVKIENERSLNFITLTTNEAGEFLLSDGATYIDAKDGDMIKVSIKDEVQRFKLTSDPVMLNFELAEIICPICPDCPVCEICPTPSDCPICPDCETINMTIGIVLFIIGFGLGALIVWLIRR